MLKSIVYQAKTGIRLDVSLIELKEALADREAVIWLDILEPRDNEYNFLVDIFGFHHLTIEDCRSPYHLPKVDVYDDYLFIIWHGLGYESAGEIATSIVNVFLGRNYLVTVHGREVSEINLLFKRASKEGALVKKGSVRLLHMLLDTIVDNYYPIIDRISERVDELEEVMFTSVKEEQLRDLFKAKHQLLAVRKIVSPEREIIHVITSQASRDLVGEEAFVYFTDIYDHLVYINDMLDTGRDVVAGAIDIYLSTVSNRLNEVMKKLTIVATIFMPLTLISGIYGMNFRYMPELYWRFGYFLTLFLMFLIGIILLIYFRRKGWW
jgi:magnesium transporter